MVNLANSKSFFSTRYEDKKGNEKLKILWFFVIIFTQVIENSTVR